MASFLLEALVSSIIVYYSKGFHLRSLFLHYFLYWGLIYEVIYTKPSIFRAIVYLWVSRFKLCRITIFISIGRPIFLNFKFFQSDCLFLVSYLWGVYLFNLFLCLDFCNLIPTSHILFLNQSIYDVRIWFTILETKLFFFLNVYWRYFHFLNFDYRFFVLSFIDFSNHFLYFRSIVFLDIFSTVLCF